MNYHQKAKDKRSNFKYQSDFRKGKRMETPVMLGLKNYFTLKGIETTFELIDDDETFTKDQKFGQLPDAFFYKEGETHTFDVKFNFTPVWKEGKIAIRPHSVFLMKNNPQFFPNGKIIAANKHEFSIIDIKDLKDLKYFKPFSKKCFLVDTSEVDWLTFPTPLDDTLSFH